MLLIGESINGTAQKVGDAILTRDEAFIADLARAQCDAGAHMLDINAGVAGGNEAENLVWLLDVVQSAVPVPLVIDSADPEALAAALDAYRHAERPIVNSITGEAQKWNALLPVLAEHRTRVVALCMDDNGIPKNVEGRIEIAGRLFDALIQRGMAAGDIYFDPLVLPCAVEPAQGLVALEAIRALRQRFSEAHTVCAVSNLSTGLPARRLLNRSFCAMAIYAGLDSVVLDVRDKALMSTIAAGKAIVNQDAYCMEYITAYRSGTLTV